MSSPVRLVLPASLPPELLRFLLWLQKTEGRDKLYRLIVYASKFVVDSLRAYSTQPPRDVIERMERGASVVATSRKLFRMFRSLESTTQTGNYEPAAHTTLPSCVAAVPLSHVGLTFSDLAVLPQVSAGCAGELRSD